MLAYLLPLALLTAAPTPAETEPGAVLAPAALPAGGLAFWGLLGAPDLGVGYRQGFDGFELEARAQFNYLEVSALAEVGVKLPVFHRDRLALAPGLALGLKVDSGSRYFNGANFAFVALRPRPQLVATWALTPVLQLLGQVEVPFVAVAFGKTASQVTPLVGAGAEFRLSSLLTLAITVHGGVDFMKEPLGVEQVRGAWAIRLGVGYRLF
jgi:hypothetical protein